MSRDKQIEEMAKIIDDNHGFIVSSVETAESLYESGYRKIYDDHERQCTCYALGCQMAEELKREVAEEIFAEIDRMCIDTFGNFNHRVFAELKKEYAEGKQ